MLLLFKPSLVALNKRSGSTCTSSLKAESAVKITELLIQLVLVHGRVPFHLESGMEPLRGPKSVVKHDEEISITCDCAYWDRRKWFFYVLLYSRPEAYHLGDMLLSRPNISIRSLDYANEAPFVK